MSRSERLAPRPCMLLGWMGCLISAFAATSAPQAFGHALLLSRGEVVVLSDRIAVNLEIAAEDYLHVYGLVPDAQDFVRADTILALNQRHADWLQEAVAIYRADGQRLHAQTARARWDEPPGKEVSFAQLRRLYIQVAWDVAIDDQPELLTFRFRPREGPILPMQLVIDVRGMGQPSGTLIRLTSRGNAETVDLTWNQQQAFVRVEPIAAMTDGACISIKDVGSARFREVVGEIEVEDEAIEAVVHIPLALLETWLSLARRREDYMETDEQRAALSAIEKLVGQALTLKVNEVETNGQLIGVEFLAPRGSSCGSVSFWTGRVVGRIRFQVQQPLSKASLSWRLFNPSVLSVLVTVRSGGRCESINPTTYDSDIVVDHQWAFGLRRDEPVR